MENSRTVWTGEVRGHQIEVSQQFEEHPHGGTEQTDLRGAELTVTVDGKASSLEALDEFEAGDDANSTALREALEALHSR